MRNKNDGPRYVVRGGADLYHAERAWIVREWLSGRKNAEIAHSVGRPVPAISKAVGDFCAAMGYPIVGLTAPARVERAKSALSAFVAGGSIATQPEHMDQLVAAVVLRRQARDEHILYLKDVDGLSFREIGERLGLNEYYVQQKAAFARLRVRDLQAVVDDAIEESEIPEEYQWEPADDDVSDERRGYGR